MQFKSVDGYKFTQTGCSLSCVISSLEKVGYF